MCRQKLSNNDENDEDENNKNNNNNNNNNNNILMFNVYRERTVSVVGFVVVFAVCFILIIIIIITCQMTQCWSSWTFPTRSTPYPERCLPHSCGQYLAWYLSFLCSGISANININPPNTQPILRHCVPRGVVTTPPRSQLLDKIGTKFQRLPPCFRGHGIQRYYWEYCPT